MRVSFNIPLIVRIARKVEVAGAMAVQCDREEAEELVAEWSSDLEAVLYQPEVEEAIREVSFATTRVLWYT